MSLENAHENLSEFGKDLGLDSLDFDENNTCILGVDDNFSLHLTYEPNGRMLFLYAPLLDGLPKDVKIRLRLYEALLEGSLLGAQMVGGGCGIALEEDLVLAHARLNMEHAENFVLRSYAPVFIEAISRWRGICEEIASGKEKKDDEGGKPSASPPSAMRI